jgi:glycosyltransferase involved in cell wall biosynthesis
MRIVSLSSSFPRGPEDSAGRFVFDLHAALVRRGHDVTTVAPAHPGAPETEDGPAGLILRIPTTQEGPSRIFYGAGLEARFRLRPSHLSELMSFAKAARDRLRGRPADLGIGHWLVPGAWILGSAVRAPVIGLAHGGDVAVVLRSVLGPWLRRGLRRRLAGWAATTLRARAALARALPGKPGALVRMGCDCDALAGPGVGGDSGPSLLGVGRLVRIKGFDLLIEAAARLGRPVELVGDGPERERLLVLAARRGVPLTLHGTLPRAAAVRAMRQAAAVVLPSRPLRRGREEGTPLVLSEALALGCRVVGAASGGIGEVLPASLCFAPGDPGDLARVLARVLASPADPAWRDLALDAGGAASALLALADQILPGSGS